MKPDQSPALRLACLQPPCEAVDRRQHWREHYAALLQALAGDDAAAVVPADALLKVLCCSEFVAQWLSGYDGDPVAWVLRCCQQPDCTLQAIKQSLLQDCPLTASTADFMAALRRWRNQWQAYFMFRHITALITLPALLERLSAMADCAIAHALRYAYDACQARWGQPAACPLDDQPQLLAVLALGKLGAQELNLSSDIDLLFVYSADADTAPHSISHQEFFSHVGRLLIQLLEQHTQDGIVFRVDMRLRPWGNSGPLVVNLAAATQYYQQHARAWERYAMIKARVVCAPPSLGKQIRSLLQAFVYRRYIDYQALAALREIKTLMLKAERRQGHQVNIKLGEGGIRELEFIVQAFQLIHGGADARLRTPRVLAVLPKLAASGVLEAAVVTSLASAYTFLRDLEHALQALQDRQTQTLPQDPRLLASVAWIMGCSSNEQLQQQLAWVRQQVHYHFAQLLLEDARGHTDRWQLGRQIVQGQSPCLPNWPEDLSWQAYLQAFIARWQPPHHTGVMAQRLQQWLPILLTELTHFKQPLPVLQRVEELLDSILKRSSYLVLLIENATATGELLKLIHSSAWMAQQFIDFPFLLDELCDCQGLYQWPSKRDLREDLREQLWHIAKDDLEQLMECLRHFNHSRRLRAAACEVTAALPLMKISDYLSWLAEVVVQQAYHVAYDAFVARHGVPTVDEAGEEGLAIIAYGKLGGLELGYDSDLDLVFVHADNAQQMTDGQRPIEKGVFYTRMAQRIIHILTTKTASGYLYPVDTRLRPAGSSGLLVSSISALTQYQQQSAWVWEHQALVRARFMAGAPALGQRVEQLRQQVLSRARSLDSLREAIVTMRAKMQAQSGAVVASGAFHLKHSPGGIIDVEFIVQYAVLAWAHRFSELIKWSDNMRILEALAQTGCLSTQQAQALQQAYLGLRAALHQQILLQAPIVLSEPEELQQMEGYRQDIIQIWQQLLQS